MDTMIFQSKNKAIGYLSSCTYAATDTVRKWLQSEEAYKVHGQKDLKVETKFPVDVKKYPYIQVMYSNTNFQPASLNEWFYYEYEDDKTGAKSDIEVAVYKYEGEVRLNLYSNSPDEANLLGDAIIACIGINPQFKYDLIGNPYINIHPNTKTLALTNANESVGTPWDSQAIQVNRQFSFKVIGEFYYVDRIDPVFISKLDFGVLINGDTERFHVVLEEQNERAKEVINSESVALHPDIAALYPDMLQ